MHHRMMAPSIRNEMDIAVSGPAELTLKSKVIIVTTSVIAFNKEFEEKTPDGRNSKVWFLNSFLNRIKIMMTILFLEYSYCGREKVG